MTKTETIVIRDDERTTKRTAIGGLCIIRVSICLSVWLFFFLSLLYTLSLTLSLLLVHLFARLLAQFFVTSLDNSIFFAPANTRLNVHQHETAQATAFVNFSGRSSSALFIQRTSQRIIGHPLFSYFLESVFLSSYLVTFLFLSLSWHSALYLLKERGKTHLENGRRPLVTDLSPSCMAVLSVHSNEHENTNNAKASYIQTNRLLLWWKHRLRDAENVNSRRRHTHVIISLLATPKEHTY